MVAQQHVKSVHSKTRIESEAVRSAAEGRTMHKPVIVKGISRGELITITPSMFGTLDVDPGYQRGKTSMVGQIVRAIQAGGSIFDPVTLCRRKGSDRLWIVDGYQRVCAFQETKTPFLAMLHESDSANDEHQFFISLNAKRALSSNVIVKAWTGPIGVLLQKANTSPEHPLYNRINFTQAQNASRISAGSFSRWLCCIAGVSESGRIEVLLSRLDMAMGKANTRAKIEHFLRLFGRICPSSNIPHLAGRAIATVAAARWRKEIYMPDQKVIDRLRLKQWASEFIMLEKYFAIIVEGVSKIWREK